VPWVRKVIAGSKSHGESGE